jgi:hypothetical protein
MHIKLLYDFEEYLNNSLITKTHLELIKKQGFAN